MSDKVETSDPAREELDRLAVKIKQAFENVEALEHGAWMALGATRIQVALKAGNHLIRAKSLVRHGEWEKWLNTNVPTLSQTTACRWMAMAKDPNLSKLTDLPDRKLSEFYENYSKKRTTPANSRPARADDDQTRRPQLLSCVIAFRKQINSAARTGVTLSPEERNQFRLMWNDLSKRITLLLGAEE